MKELDFLPRSFHEARRRRYLMRQNGLYATGLVIALGCLHFMNDSQLRLAEASLASLHAGDQERMLQRTQLQVLQARKLTLQERIDLISRLEDDAPPDAVIAAIARHMSDSMAIRSLTIEVTDLEDAGPEKTDSLLERGPTRGVLCGVAADDMQVGILLGRLAGSALFDDVRLSFSRETEEAGRKMREFELVFTIKRVAFAEGERDEGEI